MTRERAAELEASGVLPAWRHGRNIQWALRTDDPPEWKPVTSENPIFYGHLIFRVEPEVKIRPWKAEEVPVGAVMRHKEWVGSGNLLITGVWGDCVMWMTPVHGPVERQFQKMVEEGWVYSIDPVGTPQSKRTWRPCGVVEDGE